MASLTKRKLHDFAADDSTAIATLNHLINKPTKMRKDKTALHSPSTSRSLVPDPTELQFFVRTMSGDSLVVRALSTDTICSIIEKIQPSKTMSNIEYRFIYGNKQLQEEQTLQDCGVVTDTTLKVVGRMRSTENSKAWLLTQEMLSLILRLLKNNSPVPVYQSPYTIKYFLEEFLSKTPDDTNKASGHLQMFADCFAPQKLVMLYLSSYKPHRDAADECIRIFIMSTSKDTKHKYPHHKSVPIVLEFCRLLSDYVGNDDPLYIFCRSSLGTMVDSEDVGEDKGFLKLHDIFPFVKELAAKLSNGLVMSMGSTTFVGPSLIDVTDFSAYLVLVMKKIKQNVAFRGPIKMPLNEEKSFVCEYNAEITYLHGIFRDLLVKIEKCLVKYEEGVSWAMKQDGQTIFSMKQDGQTIFSDRCQCLAILKELNSISKLYHGCEEMFWNTMKPRKGALCYLIVKHAKRNDDHKWILDCREVTNFEARRHLSMMMLPELKDEFEELHEMLIDRSRLLSESFEYIAHANLKNLRAGLFMEFKNEEASGPGVLREWFFLVCQEIFNPQNALFVACPNDLRRFFPNPASKVHPMHLEYFTFSGRVIALALMHKVQVGIVFDRVLFLQLAGHSISLEDIRDADPYLYNSCKQILEMDSEIVDQDALGLTFVHEIDELGARKVIELCPGGKNIVVNSKNRKRYVDALIQHRFVTVIREQVDHFARGFADIMNGERFPRSFFHCLEPEDLDCILHGSESEISIDDWKSHIEYQGFKETDPQISWFWEVVGEMSTEQRKVLLCFWTSIKYLPVEGFSGLASRLYIYKTSEKINHLPSSHTCFYRICFPAYPSLSVMRDRLQVITQEHVGCSFGTW